jgi:hypothetical protein
MTETAQKKTKNPNPQPRSHILRAATKKRIESITSVLPAGTTTSPPVTVSDPSTSSASATATSINAALVNAPPDFTMPVPPAGFVPVNFGDFRGSHPKAVQIAATPAAIVELKTATSYTTVFGAGAPDASNLANELVTASGWTTLREAIQAYLLYVRSFEVITWKQALTDLAKLDAVFKGVAANDPSLLAAFPATEKLLKALDVISARSAATRAANAKAEVAQTTAATPATGATSAPAVNPSTVSGTGGGVVH